jgi:hypothetical protein
MTFKRVVIKVVQIIVGVAAAACSKVEYDHKALGFADKTEMESAFAKGYHTKQKLDEMIPRATTAPPPKTDAPQEGASPPALAATTPTTPAVIESAKSEPPTASKPNESIDTSCATVEACASSMLIAAGSENLGQAMLIAKRIEAMAAGFKKRIPINDLG